MKFQKITAAIFTLSFATLLLGSCEKKETVSESEEEAIYSMVWEPCAEGDYPTAIRRADSLLQAPLVMSDTLRAYIMIERNVSILESGNLDWAYAYADTLTDFGEKEEIGIARMQGLQNKGIIKRRKGDYDSAISFYKEELELAVGEKDIEMEQVFSEMLAIACAENKLFDEAYSFGKRSLELSREMEDSTGILNSISTLGGILAKSGEYSRAISELAPYHSQSRDAKGILRVKYLTPLLRSYLALDSADRTREVLAETYDALKDVPKNTQAYLAAVNAEAGLAALEGRYADQWRWLQKGDSIGTMGTPKDEWYAQRAACLAGMGRYAEAYEMEKQANAALDSIRSGESESRLAELSVKYDTLQKENAIEHLKSERLTWGLIALFSVIVVAVVIAIAVSAARRNRRKLERERQEEYLKGLEYERQRMARELHDDIAGSLVALQWQLHGADPEMLEQDIIKIARKVRNMSHELMPVEFEKESFTTLLIDYVESINSSDAGSKVRLTDEGSFDWNALPPEISHELYRMVQESVRNAITHGKRNADVTITLSGSETFTMRIVNAIVDDGASSSSSGVGAKSLKVRAALINASIEIKKENGLYIVTVTQRNEKNTNSR